MESISAVLFDSRNNNDLKHYDKHALANDTSSVSSIQSSSHCFCIGAVNANCNDLMEDSNYELLVTFAFANVCVILVFMCVVIFMATKVGIEQVLLSLQVYYVKRVKQGKVQQLARVKMELKRTMTNKQLTMKKIT
jgi:ABC-type siderophore export system fused ATPase/permease subunit